MHEQLSDRTKSQAYVFSLLLCAMVLRILVGLVKPGMNNEQSALIGLSSVVFCAPSLYRYFYGEELVNTRRKRVCHSIAMMLNAGLFVFYIALA